MPDKHDVNDVSGPKIMLQLLTRDAGKFMLSTTATLGAIGIGLAAVTWMWFEWKKIPIPQPPPKLSALPPPVTPEVQTPPVTPRPVKKIKRRVIAPRQVAARSTASTYSQRYGHILWPVDHPTNGRIMYADGFTTQYSWNK